MATQSTVLRYGSGVKEMLITEQKVAVFKIRELWFADKPYDISGCHSVVFRACKNRVTDTEFECSEFPTLVLDLTQDLDVIWSNMGKKSCRYEIRRATRDGVKVQISTDFAGFCKLNKSFRKMKGLADSVDLSYIERYGTLLTANIGSELVAGQVYLEDKDNIRWLLGASKRLEVGDSERVLVGCANRALIWEAIQYAKCKGIREFDFGGYHSGDNPDLKAINFFKQTFGGVLVTHYIYQKDYSRLYAIARRVKR